VELGKQYSAPAREVEAGGSRDVVALGKVFALIDVLTDRPIVALLEPEIEARL
jgi:hypothetical protein